MKRFHSAASQLFARWIKQSITVGAIDVAIAPEGRGYVVSADYRLYDLGNDSSRDSYYLDPGPSPLPLVDASSDTAHVGLRSPGGPIRPIVLNLKTGGRWEHGNVRLVYRWEPEVHQPSHMGRPTHLVLPTALHRVLGSEDLPSPLPIISVRVHGEHGLVVRGVRATLDPAPSVDVVPYTQALIHESPTSSPQVSSSLVILSKRLAQVLPPAKAATLSDRAKTILDYFGTLTATGVPAMVVLFHPDEWPSSWGAAVKALHESNHIRPLEVVNDYELATQLATIWWGVGCTLVGRRSRDWLSAICSTFALKYFEDSDPPTYQRLVRALHVRAGLLPGAGPLSRLRRIVIPERNVQLTQYLLNAGQNSSEFYRVVGTFIRSNWGKAIDIGKLIERLQAVGLAAR